MSDRIDIKKLDTLKGNVRSLPSSKSQSNRALIINALLKNRGTLENLSPARDTELMKGLLNTPNHVIDVMDAGTTMRFLTAYFALTNQPRRMTGSDRMKERPIFPLVDALKTLGAEIQYLNKEGFPPLEIKGFQGQRTNKISVRADVSSQFISALMMTAPALPEGLTIELTGKTASLPYLLMTAELMKHFGAKAEVTNDKITIPASTYQPASYRVEPDWSAASYWFAFTALAHKAEVHLPDVSRKALQGDRVIVDIMSRLGVQSDFRDDGLYLSKAGGTPEMLEWNFEDCPDLAQTVLPVCAVLGVRGVFTGLESLHIKETDRIAALQTELGKIGSKFSEAKGTWHLEPGDSPRGKPVFQTYHDHRMAMGFAPLATRMDITIDDPAVVKKSYPGFWDDMRGIGFTTQNSRS